MYKYEVRFKYNTDTNGGCTSKTAQITFPKKIMAFSDVYGNDGNGRNEILTKAVNELGLDPSRVDAIADRTKLDGGWYRLTYLGEVGAESKEENKRKEYDRKEASRQWKRDLDSNDKYLDELSNKIKNESRISEESRINREYEEEKKADYARMKLEDDKWSKMINQTIELSPEEIIIAQEQRRKWSDFHDKYHITTLLDGKIYAGSWKDNLFHGNGIHYNPKDGHIKKGIFSEGNFLKGHNIYGDRQVFLFNNPEIGYEEENYKIEDISEEEYYKILQVFKTHLSENKINKVEANENLKRKNQTEDLRSLGNNLQTIIVKYKNDINSTSAFVGQIVKRIDKLKKQLDEYLNRYLKK